MKAVEVSDKDLTDFALIKLPPHHHSRCCSAGFDDFQPDQVNGNYQNLAYEYDYEYDFDYEFGRVPR